MRRSFHVLQSISGPLCFKMENTKESFVMYGSFLSAAEKALSLEDIARFVLLLRDYALKGEDAHSENPVIEAFLEMAKPNLKAAKKRYDDACKGREHG